ncbi:hypothetical protein QM012_001481 [Aureobasidium pullulans]|uniref:Uncharacterized protein n=1 Tax=Aureobasidium pullulans TaxID=5580 RepID=A0ABR0TE80_AURPU
MPASLIFNCTVLNNEVEFCCDTMIRPQTPRSAASSSVFSTPSTGELSTAKTVDNPTAGQVVESTTHTTPVIPWRPFKKPMVPRAAQTETSNLRSLTHFLKYTGPEDTRATRTEDVSNVSPIAAIPATAHISNPARRIGSVRQALHQVSEQADMSGLLRKAPTLTLKK